MAHFLENLTQLVECAICTEELSDPRALSCLHSFCLGCISDTIRNGKDPNAKFIQCPTCRQRTDFPEENLNKLPVDFRAVQMKQLVEGTGQKRLAFCDVCSGLHDKKIGTPAAAFCSECSLLFCAVCLPKHRNSKLTSTHSITKLTEDGIDGNFTCKLHNNTAKWYCLQCKEGVCFTCTLAENHTRHEIQSPETAYKFLATKINQQIADIKIKCHNGRPTEEIKILKSEQKKVKEHCQIVKSNIQDHSVALVARIKSGKQKLVGEVQEFEAHYENQTSEFITQLEKLCQYRPQSSCSDLTTVSKQAELLEELTKLAEVLAEKELSTKAVPQFNPTNSFSVGIVTTEYRSTNDVLFVTDSTLKDDKNKENPFPETKSDQQGDAKSTKAVIRRTFVNIKNLSGSECSPVLLVQSMKCRIMVKKYTGNKEKTFGIFLKCDKAMLSNRNCRAAITLTLVNQFGLANLTKVASHTFTETECDFGYTDFISLVELYNPRNGYIKEDEIVVEIYMDIRKPVGL